MNQKKTYEITITDKLEHISIPDMSEMIWARIEKELDADPGEGNDDGGNNNSPVSPSPSRRIVLGGIGLVVLVSFFINFSTNKKQNSITPVDNVERSAPNYENGPPASGSNADRLPIPLVGQKSIDNITGPDQAVDPGQPFTSVIDSPVPDTITQSFSQLPIVDTSTNTAKLSPPPAVKDSIAPKKQRGVSGISSSDYKIVPKKDSSE